MIIADVYYTICNSVRELAPPQQRLHRLGIDGNTTRHIFSLFPIKLYAFKNGIEMDKPPYAYIDVRM